jgi:hypothetical protein
LSGTVTEQPKVFTLLVSPYPLPKNRLVEHYEAKQEGCLTVDSSPSSVRVGFAVQHCEPTIILPVSIFSDQLRN